MTPALLLLVPLGLYCENCAIFPGFDSGAGHNYMVKDALGHGHRSAFSNHTEKVECIELCVGDENCHGVVTTGSECWFRGGDEESPRTLERDIKQCDDCTLIIIYRTPPSPPPLPPQAPVLKTSSWAPTLIGCVVLLGLAFAARGKSPPPEDPPPGPAEDRSGLDVASSSSADGGNPETALVVKHEVTTPQAARTSIILVDEVSTWVHSRIEVAVDYLTAIISKAMRGPFRWFCRTDTPDEML